MHTSSNMSRNTAGCPGQESYSLICSVLYLHGGYVHPEALPSAVWIFGHSEPKEADLADSSTSH